jgi:ABC-type sugar transport system substrate-binding protein
MLILLPNNAAPAVAARLNGLKDELEFRAAGGRAMRPRSKVIEYAATGDAQASSAALREALAEHLQAAWVVSLSDSGAATLADVIRDAGKRSKVRLIAFDQSEEALAAIEAGRVHAAVTRDPFELGYMTVTWLANLCRSDELGLPMPGRGQANMPSEIVHRRNLAQYRANLMAQRNLPQG